jgi:hypothetical protein
MKLENYIGKKFGQLVVLERASNAGIQTRWLCRCDCGKESIKYANSLKNGNSTHCGCRNGKKNIKNLVDKKFGKLTVLKYDGRLNNRTMWLCQCECGNKKSICGDYLQQNKTKSCGCITKAINPALNKLYHSYRRGAKIRNLEFSIDKDFLAWITKQNCIYCNINPSNICKPPSWARPETQPWIYNGIDRVDNTIGYISSNCVPCCSDCNTAKMTMNTEYFLRWLSRIVKSYNQNNKKVRLYYNKRHKNEEDVWSIDRGTQESEGYVNKITSIGSLQTANDMLAPQDAPSGWFETKGLVFVNCYKEAVIIGSIH